jgi:nitronate monooxygenase
LAGNVARLNGVAFIASMDLRRLHPIHGTDRRSRDKDVMNDANFMASRIRAAKDCSGTRVIAVNVMRAVTEYPGWSVKPASGADAIVMGAGLPLDLPDLTADFPHVALIPILSDVRGVALVLKKWQRKNRMPDAIVIEHPRYAGGHLGAAKPEDVTDARFDFETVLPGVLRVFEEMGLEPRAIPVIPAGGINTHERVRELIALGASAVQLGTPFAVSEEGDAHPTSSGCYEAKPEDITTISVVCRPVRLRRTG